MSQQARNRDLLDDVREFFRRYYHDDIGTLAQKYPKDQQSLTVDWMDIYRYDPDLADDLQSKPGEVIEYFNEALRTYDLPIDVSFSQAEVRITNIDEAAVFEVGETRATDVQDLVGINGQVTKTSDVKAKPVEAAFECQRCGTITTIPQTGNDWQEPHECNGCERQGPFRLNVDGSELVDHQLVRIKQPPDQAQGAEGSSIDTVVEKDLAGEVNPGDRVTATGILEIENNDDDSPVFDEYLDASAVTVEQTDFEDIDITEYEDDIEELANNEPIEQLRDSLAPKIYGHDEIKEALILQLFGGVRSELPDGSLERGDSHILLMGDPGCGKSSLLRAVESISPRSTYASGKGASAAGMTGAAVRDDFGDTEWSIEAGALAVANNGIACVDEIDKVNDDAVSSLHDALESQKVDIAKAGINATLEAKTALLAAGNPKYGRFDEYEPVAEQIDLGPTLLSRFDLMFMLTDSPDTEKDEKMARHMTDARRKANRYTHAEKSVDVDVDDVTPAVDADLMRAYIAHAKQEYHPYIPEEQAEKIESWFTNLRACADDPQGDNVVPVTARKVEAMQRLAEASARARLSEVVEDEDVERARRLTMNSMRDVGVDPESGEFDADVVESGMSSSQRDRIKQIKTIISDLENEYDAGAPVQEVKMVAMDLDIETDLTEHEISKLKQKGEVYEPKANHLRTS